MRTALIGPQALIDFYDPEGGRTFRAIIVVHTKLSCSGLGVDVNAVEIYEDDDGPFIMRDGVRRKVRWCRSCGHLKPVELTWRRDAACRHSDIGIFFDTTLDGVAAAKQTCKRCDVRRECLEYALVTQSDEGVFGGLTGKERRILRSRKAS